MSTRQAAAPVFTRVERREIRRFGLEGEHQGGIYKVTYWAGATNP
jgi:hypothetical protein